MEKSQKKYITKNLVKLIDCTKNIPELTTSLTSNDFISHSTYQRLRKENLDDFTLTKEIYMECMKTPDYDLLIECLEESDNENAAKILKNINQTATTSSKDFTVSDNGVYTIVDLFKKDNLWGDRWAELQKLILSPSALNSIEEERNFGIRVLKDLQAWKEFQKEKATFDRLHAIVKEINPEAAAILLTAKSDIMKSD